MSGGVARWLARLVVAALGVLAILLGAEAVLRIVGSESAADVPGYSLRDLGGKNLDGVFLGVPYRTDGHGARGPRRSPTPPTDVFRIVFAGDSVTMGWRVEEEDAYPMRVAERLDSARSGTVRHQSVNLGLAGVNIAGAMDRLEMGAAAYDPDLLVYGYTLNDIEGPEYRKGQSPARAMELMQRSRRLAESPLHVVRWLWPRLVALEERWRPTLIPYPETLRDNYLENPAAWRTVEDGLDRFARLATERDVCALLLIHPELDDLGADRHPYLDLYAKIVEAARARGIAVARAFPRFAGRDADALKVRFGDRHPGVEAHALLADAVVEGLQTLPPGCLEKRNHDRG